MQALFVDHYLSLGGGTEYSVTNGISASGSAAGAVGTSGAGAGFWCWYLVLLVLLRKLQAVLVIQQQLQ
jgi:hypothetical protein